MASSSSTSAMADDDKKRVTCVFCPSDAVDRLRKTTPDMLRYHMSSCHVDFHTHCPTMTHYVCDGNPTTTTTTTADTCSPDRPFKSLAVNHYAWHMRKKHPNEELPYSVRYRSVLSDFLAELSMTCESKNEEETKSILLEMGQIVIDPEFKMPGVSSGQPPLSQDLKTSIEPEGPCDGGQSTGEGGQAIDKDEQMITTSDDHQSGNTESSMINNGRGLMQKDVQSISNDGDQSMDIGKESAPIVDQSIMMSVQSIQNNEQPMPIDGKPIQIDDGAVYNSVQCIQSEEPMQCDDPSGRNEEQPIEIDNQLVQTGDQSKQDGGQPAQSGDQSADVQLVNIADGSNDYHPAVGLEEEAPTPTSMRNDASDTDDGDHQPMQSKNSPPDPNEPSTSSTTPKKKKPKKKHVVAQYVNLETQAARSSVVEKGGGDGDRLPGRGRPPKKADGEQRASLGHPSTKADGKPRASLGRPPKNSDGEHRAVCKLCKKSISIKGGRTPMFNHSAVHMDGRAFQCLVCDQEYRTYVAWYQHFKNQHKPEDAQIDEGSHYLKDFYIDKCEAMKKEIDLVMKQCFDF